MKTVKLTTLILIVFCTSTAAQTPSNCPTNIDFEQGTFTNWECFTGNTNAIGGVNNINLTASAPTFNRHEVISSATALDPFGGFLQRCPYGGNYSVKLGNSLSGSQAEGISYTFQVPALADTFSLTYYYAVVFQDPEHLVHQQPRFFVTAYDVLTGNVINCASYNYVSNGGIPGFQVSQVDTSVLFKDWTPVSIDFAGLSGRTVRLEFKTADCTLGGHFGYAYLDVGTGCQSTLATAPYCVETNLVQLNAPYGFQSYTWYNSNYTAVLGNQQNINLSPPPAVNTIFHVAMVPYPGFGCRDTADAIVKPLPVPDTPVAVSTYSYCQNANAQRLTATAEPDNILLWYSSATGGVPSSIAPIPSTAVAGVFYYYVAQKKLFGCESNRKRIQVSIIPKPTLNFTVNNARQCQTNNQFVWSNITTDTLNSTWTWDFADGQSASTWDATHSYANPGNYAVSLTVTNNTSCVVNRILPVTVVPKPVANFSHPTTICANQTPVTITDNSSVPGGLGTINSWAWWLNGSPFTGQTPPVTTAAPGNLTIQLLAKTAEGCVSDTTSKTLTVHYLPTAAFQYSRPLCNNEVIQFTDRSSLPAAAAPDVVANWSWQFSDGANAATQNTAHLFTQGNYHAVLTVVSNVGCKSNAADSVFTIYPKPSQQLSINDSCIRRNILYKASSPANDVVQWLWDFGNGFVAGPSPVSKIYFTEGDRTLRLIGQTVHGCKDTIVRPYTIYSLSTFLPADTVAAKGEPVLLDPRALGDTSGAAYTWTPPIGLNDAFIKTPTAIWETDQLYNLKAVSIHGCDSYSKILVRRYKGPDLYIPTAFSPNGDGLNDVARVFPAGIKSFLFFSVYNRNGQLIFSTTDYTKGWDGTYKGVGVDPGNFVVIAKAIDYKGNVLFKKQNLLLLR